MKIIWKEDRIKLIPKRYKDIKGIQKYFTSEYFTLTIKERETIEQEYLLCKFIVLFKEWEGALSSIQKRVLIRPKVDLTSYVAKIKTRERIYYVVRIEGNPEIECPQKLYNAAKKVDKIVDQVITRVY